MTRLATSLRGSHDTFSNKWFHEKTKTKSALDSPYKNEGSKCMCGSLCGTLLQEKRGRLSSVTLQQVVGAAWPSDLVNRAHYKWGTNSQHRDREASITEASIG